MVQTNNTPVDLKMGDGIMRKSTGWKAVGERYSCLCTNSRYPLDKTWGQYHFSDNAKLTTQGVTSWEDILDRVRQWAWPRLNRLGDRVCQPCSCLDGNFVPILDRFDLLGGF